MARKPIYREFGDDDIYDIDNKGFPLVYIVWKDARCATESWTCIEDRHDFTLAIIHTVGWLVKETEEFMAVVQSLTNITEQHQHRNMDHDIIIPKVGIIQYKNLSERSYKIPTLPINNNGIVVGMKL